MTKKDAFIEIVKKEIFDRDDIYVENYPDIFEDAKSYFLTLVNTQEKEKPPFTENGKMILDFMIANLTEFNNLFKSKDIAERIGVSSRTVSGAIRKLVTDGYVEKMEGSPITYSLTEKGINVKSMEA